MNRAAWRLRALARQADGGPSANVGNKKGRGQRRAESRDVFLLLTSNGRATYCRVHFIMFHPPQRHPRGHFLWPNCRGVSHSIGTRRPFSAWRPAFWLIEREESARQWQESLWLAVQLNESVHKKRNGKRKGEPVAVVSVISPVLMVSVYLLTPAFYQTYSWVEVAILARVVSMNPAVIQLPYLNAKRDYYHSCLKLFLSREVLAVCSSAAFRPKTQETWGNATVWCWFGVWWVMAGIFDLQQTLCLH